MNIRVRKLISILLAAIMSAGSLEAGAYWVQASEKNKQEDIQIKVDDYVQFDEDSATEKTEDLVGAKPYVRLLQASSGGTLSQKAVSTQSSQLPSSWNTTLNSSKVRSQGYWGTCWAHVASTNFERLVEGTGGAGSLDYAEEYMAKKLSQYGDLGYTTSTKNKGGNFLMSSGYYVGGYGPMEESSYQYYGSKSHDLDADSFSTKAQSSIRATSVVFLPCRQRCTDANMKYQLSEDSVNLVKAAIMEYGSVCASIYFEYANMNVTPSEDYDPIQTYNFSTGAYCYPWKHEGNHAITIVGWDDNYSGDNFCSDVGDGAWIVQNSYGSKFGKNGYNYVSYEDGTINVDGTVTAYESMGNDEKLYQLDDAGSFSSLSSSASYDLQGYMNVFELTEDSKLESVTFYCPFSNERCRIYMVPIGEDGEPQIAEKQLISEDYKTPYQGYHTIELFDDIVAAAGKIGILVAQDGDTASNSIGIGREYGYSSWNRITIKTGESYKVYGDEDSAKCVDATKSSGAKSNSTGGGNYSIKLKTKPASASDHIHQYTENVIKEATCSEPGEVEYTCSCGDSYTAEVQAKGHSFGEWKEVEAEENESGNAESGNVMTESEESKGGESEDEVLDVQERECSVCGYKERQKENILKVHVKESKQISLDNLYGNVIYTTANKKIATVSTKGLVKGLKAGTTTVTVKASGDENHDASTTDVKIIVPINLTKAVLSKSSFTYDGSEHIPTITSLNGSKKLVEGRDYTVEWPEKAIIPGTYTVKITGKGNFEGSFSKTYKITKAKASISVDIPKVYVEDAEVAEQEGNGDATGDEASSAEAESGSAGKASESEEPEENKVKLEPEVYVTNAKGQKVDQTDSARFTYKSSNKKVLTVDEDGTLHGLKAGSAKVTITAVENDCCKKATKTVKITVK